MKVFDSPSFTGIDCTGMRRICVSLAFLAVAGPSSALDCAQPLALRSSAPNIIWRATGANDVLVEGDDTFLVSATSVRKLETRTGRLAWSLGLTEHSRTLDAVVLPAHIAIIRNGRSVAFVDRVSGKETHRIDADGRIARLIGPPLVAVTVDGPPEGQVRSLVRISDDGVVLRRAEVGRSANVSVIGGVAAFAISDGNDDPIELRGIDLATLQVLWSLTWSSDTLWVHSLDGRFYVGDVFWSDGARVIEPRSGVVTTVPRRDPQKIGGSGDFDLQVVSASSSTAQYRFGNEWSPYFRDCEELRRSDNNSGRTRWQVDLPFGITATLRDGARLWVAGSRDHSRRYLVALDWETGAVERAWTGLPMLHELRVADDLILGYELEGEIVAIRARR